MIQVSDHAIPDRVLRWVIHSVHPQATIQAVRRLHGGISSIVHSVSLKRADTVTNVVCRQFDNAAWLQEEPDLARHEAESLRRASQIGVPTPQLIAFDETGTECGVPAVLMTQLEGSVVLKPNDMQRWLNGLAESLVMIHAVEAEDCPWAYYTYNDIAALETPSWSGIPESWSTAIDMVKGPPPDVKRCFIHRDYHPANVLWNGDKVSGIVDWVNACRGPAGIDIGHCRLNLAQLYGVEAADAFLSAYRKQAGKAFNYDPYWDLLSLIDVLFGTPQVYAGWTALGFTGLSDKLIMERLDAYLLSVLARERQPG